MRSLLILWAATLPVSFVTIVGVLWGSRQKWPAVGVIVGASTVCSYYLGSVLA